MKKNLRGIPIRSEISKNPFSIKLDKPIFLNNQTAIILKPGFENFEFIN